jgi:LuxR family quorum-sensing system transcriptional regulator SolR
LQQFEVEGHQEWLHGFAEAKTEAALLDLLARAANELGFDYCALGMRLPLPFSNPRTVMVNNYPQAWQQRYQSEQYLKTDPTVAQGMVSTRPLLWSEALFASSRPLWEDARAHGLHVGWAQPAHDHKGVASLLTFARSGEVIAPSEFQANAQKMHWLAQAAHAALSNILAARPDGMAPIKLTEREVEVLRWAADGKTASESAEILSISERTVIFHIDNAMRKLGAANKTAGVLKAAMLRLI